MIYFHQTKIWRCKKKEVSLQPMAFTWKEHKDIFKGEGVYFLTFVVAERRSLLGELVPLTGSQSAGSSERTSLYDEDVSRLHNTDMLPYKGWRKELCTSKLAAVALSEFGLAIHRDLMDLPSRYSGGSPDGKPNIIICGKQFMPNHIHVVIWVRKDLHKSILQIAHGFRTGITKIARELGVWPPQDCVTEGREYQSLIDRTGTCDADVVPYHVLEKPFVRTLSRKGQMDAMIKYMHANPDNAWRRRRNPELYVIRRNRAVAGLHFDCMGKERLLDYPDRQTVALSRSLTEEQIAEEVRNALWHAECGVVTYTAAIANGEKAVARAVREAGYPLVIMMLDGFPAEGTEAARYFHPSGVYHTACGEGRLLLMAPSPGNYTNEMLIALTDEELRRKAVAKGLPYSPIPHDSKRWRMMAGNVMLTQLTVCNT